jgi:hypothetical protein
VSALCCTYHATGGPREYGCSTKAEYVLQSQRALRLDSSDDPVKAPAHYAYGRKFEPWDVILDWGLGFLLGNVVKYVARAGRKGDALEDLRKAREYLDKEIASLEGSK